MEQPFAAGIIPYIFLNGEYYFLLGLERSNNKWSGFVGGSEIGELPINTALREFNEETAMIFEKNTFIKKKLTTTTPVIERSLTGKTVYLWFLEFPQEFLFKLTQFHYNQSIINDSHFKEKSDIRWFSLHQLKSAKILYRLKKTIQFYFPMN
jgi:8-oxo-dGTP pyrophosphatase MutT (NUDIX family)